MNMRYNNNGDDYTDYKDEEKKPSIVGRILKWIVYLFILFIYVFFMVRIFLSCEPKDSKLILVDQTALAVLDETGEDDFVLYKIKSRDSFGDGDTFFLSNVVYLESSEQLQLTLRYKKKNLDPYWQEYNWSEYEQDSGYLKSLFGLILRLSETDADSVGEIPANDYYSYQFETDKYFYHRVNFSGVKIDYKSTRVELFITFGASSIDSLSFSSDSDYLARFTIFDVNTPKEKSKIGKFDVKTLR